MASGVNDLLPTTDTAVPETLDAFLATPSYFSLVDKQPGLMAFAADFQRAYKHLGTPLATLALPQSSPRRRKGLSTSLRCALNLSEVHARRITGAA